MLCYTRAKSALKFLVNLQLLCTGWLFPSTSQLIETPLNVHFGMVLEQVKREKAFVMHNDSKLQKNLIL